MVSENTHYRVLRAVHLNLIDPDHHTIFVGTGPGKGGQVFHVLGSIQQGMTLAVGQAEEPLGSATCRWV